MKKSFLLILILAVTSIMAVAEIVVPMLSNYVEPVRLEDRASNVLQGLRLYKTYHDDFAQPQDTGGDFRKGNGIYILDNPDVSARLKRMYTRSEKSYGTITTDSVELYYDFNGHLTQTTDWHNGEYQYRPNQYVTWKYTWEGNRLKRAEFDSEYESGVLDKWITYTLENDYSGGFKAIRKTVSNSPSLGRYEEEAYEVYDKNKRLIEYYIPNKPFTPQRDTYSLDEKGRLQSHSHYSGSDYKEGERYEYLEIPEYGVAIASKFEEYSGNRNNPYRTTTKSMVKHENGTVEFITKRVDPPVSGSVTTSTTHNYGKFIEKDNKFQFYPDSIVEIASVESNTDKFSFVSGKIRVEYSLSKMPICVTDSDPFSPRKFEYVWDERGNVKEGTMIQYNKTDNIWQRIYGFEAEYAQGSDALLSVTNITYGQYEQDPYGVPTYRTQETYDVDSRFPGSEILVGGNLYEGEGMLLSRNGTTYEYEILRIPELGVSEVSSEDRIFRYDGNTVYVSAEECRQITLYDISGKLIVSAVGPRIDVYGLESGIYIVCAVIGNRTHTVKIVK